MSWGYWGIVAGLLSLLALFFICVDIVHRGSGTAAGPSMPGSAAQDTADAHKHAA